jgi:hypothetical protein
MAALVPSPSGLFDLRPVGLAPSFERGKRFVEGSTELGQPVEGGGVDAAGVEMTHNQAVAFGSSQRVGEHFVRDPVEGIVEFLIAATPIHEFGEHGESPPAVNDTHDSLR